MTKEQTDPMTSLNLGRHAAAGAPGGTPGQHAVKLDRSVYSGRVASVLREAIVEGTLVAGEPLVEARLAEQLAVSRGPIRNALHVLEGEGLVRTQPNGRSVVVGFSAADLEDLVGVRFELESTAIRRGIAARADTAPIRSAYALVLDEGASTQRLVDFDIDFHRALLEFSGSRFLTQAWLALAPVIHTVITIGNRRMAEADPDENFTRIISVHAPLVDAIEAYDASAALRLLGAQFAVTREMFAER
ncbi:GntR family transcriptional regulator [Conexibacter sp. CPCC 206217]|uniref:GntR family transcriptional regulator n=1 Tax=Conexibacter sp. CPCC 206217 TaxID=3064574 RepID=UPI00271E1A29|nr:GntR family transcriptional regulator [Conexibacter sp. CPCC 206217]MDO8209942.1 GntR family transcriptional regulator [Conexibacter sp. CPCC 206217]